MFCLYALKAANIFLHMLQQWAEMIYDQLLSWKLLIWKRVQHGSFLRKNTSGYQVNSLDSGSLFDNCLMSLAKRIYNELLKKKQLLLGLGRPGWQGEMAPKRTGCGTYQGKKQRYHTHIHTHITFREM